MLGFRHTARPVWDTAVVPPCAARCRFRKISMADTTLLQVRDESPILATKLYLPRARPTRLARPRLRDRLEHGLDSPLTLVSAPTGWGKTALLTDWLGQHQRLPQERREPDGQRAVAWLSLDSGDDDLAQFLRYLVAACQTLVPSAGTAVLVLLQGSPGMLPPLAALLTPLINDLARVPTQSIVVLDDYHVITDPRIHDAITFLVDHLPPEVHLIITSRVDPPLPLARWRAHGLLTEVRAADLRFTVEEAAAFLTEVMRLPLAIADVAALEQRTEGWIAGLQFAALALRDRTDLARFVQAFTGSHRFVVDYLVDEVLVRQPPHIQAFLLHTAILDRLCSSLCDDLVGDAFGSGPTVVSSARGASQAVLEELEQANLFVVPLDDVRQWYRYHHLFADVLRHRLASSATPDEVRMLHSRAAAWFEQQGLIAEAFQHSLAAAEYERCARLVEQVGPQHQSRGELGLLQRWLAQLPAELLRTRPRLSLIVAWTLSFTADLDAVVARLDDVERLLADDSSGGPSPTVRDELEGEVLATRGFVAYRRQQIPEAITLMQQAQPRLPVANRHMRGMNLHHLGLAHRVNGDLTAAERALAEAIAIFEGSAETRTYAVYPLKNLGIIAEARGHLRQAKQTYRRALAAAVVSDRLLPSAGHAYACLGRLHYEWNDLPTAATELRQAIDLGRQGNLHQIVAEAAIELAPVLQAQGAVDEVEEVLKQAQEAARQWNDARLVARAAATAARVRLLQGRIDAARHWAEDAGLDLDEVREVELAHLTFARLLLAQGQRDEARQLLERLAAQAEAGDQVRGVLEALALLAVAEHELRDDTQALAILERALGLAEPEGYIRTFLDAGPPLAVLLAEGLRRSDWGGGDDRGTAAVRTYARSLLECFPSQPAVSAPPAHPPAILPPGVEPLTPRELEVLRLIAAGQSNGEIARTLVVAVSTVKAHINNIFAKLGATSRTQALVIAHERELL